MALGRVSVAREKKDIGGAGAPVPGDEEVGEVRGEL